MTNDWHKIWITDKNGGEHFNTIASPMSIMSEIRNLKRHIECAKNNKNAYKFLDADTAQVIVDGEPWTSCNAVSDDQLLAALGL